MKRLGLILCLFLAPGAWADWAADRDASAGYVTVTTLATAVDEAVPFVYVKGSDLPSAFHAAMDAAGDTDGKTIRFSTSDGSTQLPCVVVGPNTSTDTFGFFGLATGMSASVDVDYRIYVGNASLSMPTDSGGMGCQAVFAAYAGVYMPGVSTKDWTSGGRTLTAVNSPGTAASGFEGITAATYNGSSQYHKYTGTQAVTDWPITLESLAYATNTTHDGMVFSLSDSADNFPVGAVQFAGSATSDFIRGSFRGDSGSQAFPTTSAAFSATTWYYLAASATTGGGSKIAYIDGGSSGSATTSITAPTWADITIGNWLRAASTQFLNGRVAVALLSSSVRSADYIATMHDNWAGALYSTGAWTANDSDVIAGSTGWVLFQTAGQSSTADVDWINTSNVLVDDATYAYCTVSDAPTTTEYLNLTNPAYGLTVPTGAPSYTVEFRVKGYRGNSSGGDRLYDETIQFIDDTGTRVGTNLAKTSEDWTTSATTRDYVLSGYTPDGTEFTSAAGLAIRVTGADAVGTLDPRVVTAWIRVSWTGTDPAHNTRGFFALTD